MTVQSLQLQKATRNMLSAVRANRGYTQTVVVAPDMPLDRKALGKDVVASVFNGVKSDAKVDGRYVDIVGGGGERIKVYTRALNRDANNFLRSIIGTTETQAINFAKDFDKPDFICLVVYNPLKKTVDVFKFSPDPETKKFGNYYVGYSERTFSYSSKEAHLVKSIPV